MKLTETFCYSHVLYLLDMQEFTQAINKIEFYTPNIGAEGFNGYIETSVTIDVKDLEAVSKQIKAWYSIDDKIRSEYYKRARGI